MGTSTDGIQIKFYLFYLIKLYSSSDSLGRENEVPDCHRITIAAIAADANALLLAHDIMNALDSAGQELVRRRRVETSIHQNLNIVYVDVHERFVPRDNRSDEEAHGQEMLALLQPDARYLLFSVAIQLLLKAFDFVAVCPIVFPPPKCFEPSSEHFDSPSQKLMFGDSPFLRELDDFLHRL